MKIVFNAHLKNVNVNAFVNASVVNMKRLIIIYVKTVQKIRLITANAIAIVNIIAVFQ
jgi:hypothetical protein